MKAIGIVHRAGKQASVSLDDAFGNTGRARGIDEARGGIGGNDETFVRPSRNVRALIDVERTQATIGTRLREICGVTDHQTSARIGQDEIVSVRSQRRIQEDILLARFQHPQNRGDRLRPRSKDEGDRLLPRRALVQNRTRYPIGGSIQLLVGQVAIPVSHCRPIRVLFDRTLETRGDRLPDVFYLESGERVGGEYLVSRHGSYLVV